MATREQQTNGSGEVAQTAPGPRLHRREIWVDLPSPYDGFKVKVWLNHPGSLLEAIREGTSEERYAALGRVFLEHNGWEDFEGTRLPQPDNRTFWDAIPNELGFALLAVLEVEREKLPNLVRRHSGR